MNRDWLEKDFYKVLGVSQNASIDEIKKNYKKLARENHPDLNPGDPEAEKRFKDISEASSVLADDKKRQEYDQVRAMGPSAFSGQGGGFNAEDLGDIFGNLGDIFGFGGAGRRKGQSYQTNLTISFVESASGLETNVPLNYQPSGSLNFSKVDDANLELTLNQKISYNHPVEVSAFGLEYNVFRVINGLAGLAFYT